MYLSLQTYGPEPSKQFPSSPVIYVDKGGLYRCTVKYGSAKVDGNITNVVVEVGKYVIRLLKILRIHFVCTPDCQMLNTGRFAVSFKHAYILLATNFCDATYFVQTLKWSSLTALIIPQNNKGLVKGQQLNSLMEVEVSI